MKYTILSINDDRRAYKDDIRKYVPYEEVDIAPFNAYEEDPLQGLKDRSLELKPVWPNAKKGELGVWLSNYDRWAHADMLGEPLIVFEDDAVVRPHFANAFRTFIKELPDDWDFAALWVPENQLRDYRYSVWYELGVPRINGTLPDHIASQFDYGAEHASLVYQGYGMVSLVYSPNGGRKLVDLAHQYGLTGPVDCWIYEQAHMNNVKGYAPKPDYADIVSYDWSAVSHVQLTERV